MGCCCSNADAKTVGAAEKYKAQKGFLILGGGCKNCHALMQNTIDALAENGTRGKRGDGDRLFCDCRFWSYVHSGFGSRWKGCELRQGAD